ncbi:MAG: O-antigen ligase family protein [Gammaproteobacteria bacterium]|nr:O-antigen ligase family protein [Gammaproteobacteria bacterium]
MGITYNSNIDKIYQYLLIFLAFLLPLTVVGGNILMGLIVILWLLSGNYNKKFNQIKGNKLAVASLIFFAVHMLGLLWTNNIAWGLHIIRKMQDFVIFLPILLTITKKENIRYYISAFLLAITMTEVLSYLVWFEVIPAFKNATIENPTPFMSHISYNPILAFAIYLVSHEVLFNKTLDRVKIYVYSFFIITMTFNMFITGGRAGQVMYFVMLIILIFQYFDEQKKKALIAVLILIPGIFFSAYQASSIFHERVDLAIKNTINFSDNKGSSVGLRITFALNSWEIIKENPIIGVGVGDFPDEYKNINMSRTPTLPNATNPHNMYTLILVQLGLLGLVSMFYLFYVQIKIALTSKSKFLRDVGLVLPTLFLVIMWSDSYLLGHYTAFLFVFFSSFLYKDFERT